MTINYETEPVLTLITKQGEIVDLFPESLPGPYDLPVALFRWPKPGAVIKSAVLFTAQGDHRPVKSYDGRFLSQDLELRVGVTGLVL